LKPFNCFANSAFLFDLLKTRAQFNKHSQLSYKAEIRRIYQTEGLKGFTRGYSGMLMRDAPGYALYFLLFDQFKRTLGINPKDH
jgi:hypothetical protein